MATAVRAREVEGFCDNLELLNKKVLMCLSSAESWWQDREKITSNLKFSVQDIFTFFMFLILVFKIVIKQSVTFGNLKSILKKGLQVSFFVFS